MEVKANNNQTTYLAEYLREKPLFAAALHYGMRLLLRLAFVFGSYQQQQQHTLYSRIRM
jgi:hypothetical protein